MKTILFVSLVLLLVFIPAYGIPLSDRTGLVNNLDVKTDGYSFEIETVANFDITNFEFDSGEKRLTLDINSGLENNLAEMYMPKDLLSGNFTFFINGTEFFPKVKDNADISFITLNFTGAGDSKIDIIATEYLHEMNVTSKPTELPTENKSPEKGGGCLIATATYGSELVPQVQQLRELRDGKLLQTESGTSFMNSFNAFYYSFSPTIADWERESPMFKETVKITLTPLISSLSILNYVDMDSDVSVLGYGISLILLNVGMYFVAPVVVIHKVRKMDFTKLNNL
ncbi:MAG: peptidylprolyl isomerase [Nitrosarchaeum sp.]|nr:peptidylprolyl isomerase [Nitrosarchaeum sp.]